MRHTTFRFALDPTPAQEQMLAQHAGASRFAYNQCLRFVTDAVTAKRIDPSVTVPWSGYDLINAFNAWKKSEDAGRAFVVAADGSICKQVTGLSWRHKVPAQVFEEAAVDLGRALSGYWSTRKGTHAGRKVGFPRYKRKGRCPDRFRLRNKRQPGGYLIRVGEGHLRSVTLPTFGQVRVHDNTRRLRQLLRPDAQLDRVSGEQRDIPRAKILFATVARRGTRWYVSLNVQAPDFHPCRRHQLAAHEGGGYVGVDLGLVAFAVAATSDRTEIGRWHTNDPLTRRTLKERMGLAERAFRCDTCELVTDRDRNAAANLAAWAEHAQAPDRQAGGRVTNAPGGEGAGRCLDDGETGPDEGGTNAPEITGVEDTREGWRPSTTTWVA
jgi:putative transposase